MRIRAHHSIPDGDVHSLSAAVEGIRGTSGANIRLNHPGYGTRRVTISALVNGSFKIDWTGLGGVKISTTESDLAAQVAIRMMKMLEIQPGRRPKCQRNLHYGLGSILNGQGFCEICWMKLGNDVTTWIPAGIDEEMWSRLELRPKR
jgi:hypothetical protein